MEYHPNTDAVRFFRRRIWPLLSTRWPNVKWRLIGKNCEAVSRYVSHDPRIELAGPVNDAVVEQPELVNQDPYGNGWLLEMAPGNAPEDLLDADVPVASARSSQATVPHPPPWSRATRIA